MSNYYDKWKIKNPEYFKNYYLINKERINKKHYEWVKKNKEYVKEYQKEYHKKCYQSKKQSNRVLKQNKIERNLLKMKEKAELFKASLLNN